MLPQKLTCCVISVIVDDWLIYISYGKKVQSRKTDPLCINSCVRVFASECILRNHCQ